MRRACLVMLPLKKREFDLQHSLPIALHTSSPSNHVRIIVSECLEYKRSTVQNKDVVFLSFLEKKLEEWEKRDAMYRSKNPALAATCSALRLMKQWATRVVGVADMEADNSQENLQKAIETVLLQQRSALSEWLKRENDNKFLPEEIRKKCRAVQDAVQHGDEKQVSDTRIIVPHETFDVVQRPEVQRLALAQAVAWLCSRQTKEAVSVAQGDAGAMQPSRAYPHPQLIVVPLHCTSHPPPTRFFSIACSARPAHLVLAAEPSRPGTAAA
jgi:hypothetical protein